MDIPTNVNAASEARPWEASVEQLLPVSLDADSDGVSTSAPVLCVQLCSDSAADWDLPGTPLFTAVLLSLLSPPVRSFEAPELHTFFRLS